MGFLQLMAHHTSAVPQPSLAKQSYHLSVTSILLSICRGTAAACPYQIGSECYEPMQPSGTQSVKRYNKVRMDPLNAKEIWKNRPKPTPNGIRRQPEDTLSNPDNPPPPKTTASLTSATAVNTHNTGPYRKPVPRT